QKERQRLLTLEVIIGPMFSGKTSELIRLVEREVYAKRKGAIFKPALDRRYSVKEVVSHNGLRYDAHSVVTSSRGIRKISSVVDGDGLDVIGVDEVQFFPTGVVPLLDRLAFSRRVIACGLNLTLQADTFETTMTLAARADRGRNVRGGIVACAADATE